MTGGKVYLRDRSRPLLIAHGRAGRRNARLALAIIRGMDSLTDGTGDAGPPFAKRRYRMAWWEGRVIGALARGGT